LKEAPRHGSVRLMSDQTFSTRLGYAQPKAITYRDDLPTKLRLPIVELLQRYTSSALLWSRIVRLLNPYGTDDWPEAIEAIPATRTDDDDSIAVKRVLLNCPWFRVYDVIEDIFDQLDFYETGFKVDPEEEEQARPFQWDINNYFLYAGIGWHLINGKMIARGEEAFERTIKTATAVLKETTKPTAARHIQFAISALSTRPNPNTSGAVAQATNAVECVLGEITGKAMTLGKYLDKYPDLFHPALKKGLDGVYGYASDEGARHGKEGTEPTLEEAEFTVATCAAVCTLLTKKHQNPKG
jgi:AbiJ N-terminal domain 4